MKKNYVDKDRQIRYEEFFKKRNESSYVYTKKQAEAYQKLSIEQRLEWLEKTNRFIYYFMPKESKEFREKLQRGEI